MIYMANGNEVADIVMIQWAGVKSNVLRGNLAQHSQTCPNMRQADHIRLLPKC